MIKEFDVESISHQTASSATQSAICAFSAEKSKILRTFAHFHRPEALERLRFYPHQLTCARFSLSRIEPVPFAPHFSKHSLGPDDSDVMQIDHRVPNGEMVPEN